MARSYSHLSFTPHHHLSLPTPLPLPLYPKSSNSLAYPYIHKPIIQDSCYVLERNHQGYPDIQDVRCMRYTKSRF